MFLEGSIADQVATSANKEFPLLLGSWACCRTWSNWICKSWLASRAFYTPKHVCFSTVDSFSFTDRISAFLQQRQDDRSCGGWAFTSRVLKQETASLSRSSFSSVRRSRHRWRLLLVSSSCCCLYWASCRELSSSTWGKRTKEENTRIRRSIRSFSRQFRFP